MKNIYLALLIILCGFKVLAQKSKFLTLTIMPQRTFIYNKEESQHREVIQNIATYAPAYGLAFSQIFNSWAGIDYSIHLARQEQSIKIYPFLGAAEPTREVRKNILYLKIPVSFTANVRAGTNNSFYISMGPQVSFLLYEGGVVPFYVGPTTGVASDTLTSIDFIEASQAYKKLTFDGMGSLGWRMKIYKNIYFQCQLRADYSFTDIENKNYSALNGGQMIDKVYYVYSKKRPATHNIAIGLGIGVSAKIR